METDNSKEERMIAAFNTQEHYYQMMTAHHKASDGAALEPELKRIMRENAKGRVLDAGCGEGSIARWLATELPDILLYGIDISKIGVEMATAGKPDNTEFQTANLKALPFEDDYFDFAYSQSVIEHIVDYRSALAEWYRVLKPGGGLLIRVGNGGRNGVKLPRAILNYLTCRNRAISLEPKLAMRPDSVEEHRENFDAVSIPSDVLLGDLRAIGYRIGFFTTRRRMYKQSEAWRFAPWWKRILLITMMNIPFHPFSHLGPTTIVLAKKPF